MRCEAFHSAMTPCPLVFVKFERGVVFVVGCLSLLHGSGPPKQNTHFAQPRGQKRSSRGEGRSRASSRRRCEEGLNRCGGGAVSAGSFCDVSFVVGGPEGAAVVFVAGCGAAGRARHKGEVVQRQQGALPAHGVTQSQSLDITQSRRANTNQTQTAPICIRKRL